MIDHNKINEHKIKMLQNSQDAAHLIEICLNNMLQISNKISETEFNRGVEFCKAKRKLALEQSSAFLSEKDKSQIELDIDRDIDTLSSILKSILKQRGLLL